MVKRLVRYKRESGALVKMAETPVLEGGKVDIGWLPVVGLMGSAIIERGNNANGEYIKWADGTMVCTKSATVQSGPAETWGAIFALPAHIGSFPAAFTDKPFVSVYVYSPTAGHLMTSNSPNLDPTQIIEVDAIRPTGVSVGTQYPVTYSLLAIGRWK